MLKLFTILAVALGLLWVWWRFFHIARPAFPPLQIADDDPLMADARSRAQKTLDRFRALYEAPHNGANVKVPFITSSGVREYLWAEVRRLGEADAEVLYVSPPVTHTGRLERVHTHPLSDVVDWQVILPSGRYRGGYTMRVMFVRGREQWGSLPPELEAEEQRYEDET
jgi:uncharacterized protein YegJ (DUF2314 family)